MSWRRILFLTALLLVTIVGATWFVLQRTGAATGLVRSFLANLLATEFKLENAQVDLFGGYLTLNDFEVLDPKRPGSRLVAAQTLRLAVDTDPLGGVLAIHQVDIDGLQLDLDLTEGRSPNLAELLRQELPEGQGGLKVVTPARVRHARARVRVDADLPALEFSRVELQVQRSLADDGTADRERGVVSGRARFDNLGVAVDLLGDLDLVAQTCRLQAKIGDLDVDAPFLRRLLPLLRTELEADVGDGRLHYMTLQLDLPLSGDQDIVAGAAFEFSDVHCQLPQLPVPLRGATVRGVVSTRDGGIGQFTGERLVGSGETKVVAKVTDFLDAPRLEVRGEGHGVALDETVRTALRSFAAGAAVVDGLRPSKGSADFHLYLREPGTDRSVIDLDLQLHDVSLAYHGFGPPEHRVAFPLQIVGASGRVHLRDQIVSLEDVSARLAPAAGGGEVTMSGRVEAGRRADNVSIDLFAPELKFTPALREAFAVLMRDDGELYDQFQPRGAAAVRLRVRPGENGQSSWQVNVEPRDAEVTWARFPLPIAGVRGQIVARPQGLELDLQARTGDATATLRGRLLAPPDGGDVSKGRIDLRIVAERVPLDGSLRHASTTLSPNLDRMWDELAPSGACDTTLFVRRMSEHTDLVYDLQMNLVDARALPRSFPLPITHMHGEVFVHGRGEAVAVQIDAVRGTLQETDGGGCDLAVVGTIDIDDGYTEDLTAVLRGLDLTPEFGALLEDTGAVGRGTWDVMRPSGRVDVITRQQQEQGTPPVRRFSVLMRDARSDAEMLPRPATNLSGELEIEGGELTFRDVRARVGSAIVTCSQGRVGPADEPGRTEVGFVVSAERFPLDDTFARLFVGPLRKAVLERQLRGHMNVNGLSLRFLLPSDGSESPIEVVIAGRVEALDVEMLLGTRLQDVSGAVTLHESRVHRNGGTLTGSVTRGSLTFFGHPILDVQSDFVADAERFRMQGLQFGLHGGQARGRNPAGDSLVYELARTPDGAGTLAADLRFEGLSLREFLQHCGLTNTPFRGTTQGWIRLDRLDGYDFVDMAGEGSIEILDGNLGTVPIFTAIYALMAEVNRPRFRSMSLQFEVADRDIELRDLVLQSPLITVQGGGSMSMDGYLDVVLTTDSLFGGSADLLLLPPVIQIITSNLVRFHLFGYPRNLHAQQRWFAQSDPGRRPLMPVPPRLDQPMRPDY